MKKTCIACIALVWVAQMMFAASVTPAAQIPDYWSSIDGKSGSELWSAVSSRTNYGYSSIGYKGLYTAYLKTDVYPADSVGKAGKIWDMYGECVFAPSNTCGSYKGVCDCYNREHSIPQSWWGGGTAGIGNDIFHVLPTDGKVNGVRSNYEYGEVSGGTNWVGNMFGSAGSWSTDRATIASTAGESVKGVGQVFEPKQQYKGDIARGLLGTIVKWQQSNITTGNTFFSGTYTASGYYGLSKKAVVLLMKWHREDPVSQKEIDRNNGIQQTQGNRNPFIDYPYLAEYIWGEHAGESLDLSQLMASSDPDFVPGVSDGSRNGITPPVIDPTLPVVKYGVSWSVNGAVLYVDSVEENQKVGALPATPVSSSSLSPVFMGWTDEPIYGHLDEAPMVLYTKASDIPAITGDLTLYAVFAREVIVEGAAQQELCYSADCNIEGWSNTATKTNSYWLLDQGKTLVSPEVNLESLSSIVVNIRTYGGTQYNLLDVKAGEQSIAQIEATAGGRVTEYTWTNTKSLSGNSPITFSSNYGANKGIGFTAITIYAAGAGAEYSRFITSAQTTTEVLVQESAREENHKVLIGGQLYIVVGEQLFNLQGQRIK